MADEGDSPIPVPAFRRAPVRAQLSTSAIVVKISYVDAADAHGHHDPISYSQFPPRPGACLSHSRPAPTYYSGTHCCHTEQVLIAALPATVASPFPPIRFSFAFLRCSHQVPSGRLCRSPSTVPRFTDCDSALWPWPSAFSRPDIASTRLSSTLHYTSPGIWPFSSTSGVETELAFSTLLRSGAQSRRARRLLPVTGSRAAQLTSTAA